MLYLKTYIIFLLLTFLLACQKELPENKATSIGSVPTTDSVDNGNNNIDTLSHDAPDSAGYYVRFTVNNVSMEYTAYTKASFPEYIRSGAKLYACQVEAQELASGTMNAIHLTVNDTIHIITGKAYADHLLYNAYQAIINYNDGDNNVFSSVNALPDSKTTVLLTEITPDYVSGTFSGKVGNVMESGNGLFPDSAVITKGNFKVKRY